RSRGWDHAHPGEIDIELVGRNLGQRGDDALADLDLAGAQYNEARGIEAQPARESWIGGEIGRQLPGGSHVASLAARSTARTIRLWAPQRHRLRSSAARTSASLGSGLRFN